MDERTKVAPGIPTISMSQQALAREEAHKLLGVESVKQLIDQGHTLEQIWLMLVEMLVNKAKASRATEAWPQPMDADYEPLFNDPTPINMAWLNDSVKTLKWDAIASYVKGKYPEAKGATLGQAIQSLSLEKQAEFVAEVQQRLEAKRIT